VITLPLGKKAVECNFLHCHVKSRWVSACLKARLIAKEYSQMYELNYVDNFTPVTKMTYVWVLVSLAATDHWWLHQLDIKNAFLNGDWVQTCIQKIQNFRNIEQKCKYSILPY